MKVQSKGVMKMTTLDVRSHSFKDCEHLKLHDDGFKAKQSRWQPWRTCHVQHAPRHRRQHLSALHQVHVQFRGPLQQR